MTSFEKKHQILDKHTSRRSLRWKIISIALSGTLGFAIYLVFILSVTNKNARLMEEASYERYPMQSVLQQSAFELRFIQALLKDAVLTAEPELIVDAEIHAIQFREFIVSVKKYDPNNEIDSKLLLDRFNHYFDEAALLAKDINSTDADLDDISKRGMDSNENYEALLSLLLQHQEEQRLNFVAMIELASARISNSAHLGLLVGILTMLLAFGVALFVARNILQRINQIVLSLKKIALNDEDMGVRLVDNGFDEMAELAHWFNTFIEKLHNATLRSTEEIRKLAFSDTLTELPNRREFLRNLELELKRTSRNKKMRFAVMFLDLDNFKLVNDQKGHDAGDELLRDVAARLKKIIRGYDVITSTQKILTDSDEDSRIVDIIARHGGDEFMILLSDIDDEYRVINIAERILENIGSTFIIQGTEFNISVSIGIATYPSCGKNIEDLSTNADIAMYEAKRKGKNTYEFFSQELGEKSKQAISVESSLYNAIHEHENEFSLVFQPSFELENQKLVGCEALIRWNSAAVGVVAADVFIAIAEKTNVIHQIGEWVLNQTLAQYRSWLDSGIAPPSVSVNVSAREISLPDYPNTFQALCKKHGISPEFIEIEITETALLDNHEQSLANLRALKDYGISIALDDFGTGYSSLSLLKNFPIDKIKIDRMFVKELTEDKHSISIVKAIVNLAVAMDLKVVAEGVEIQEQSDILLEFGCHYCQGYLYSKPLDVSQFVDFLQHQKQDNVSLSAG